MTNDYLANRYGKTGANAKKQRVLWTSASATLLFAFLVWAIFINFATPPKLTATVQNFNVKSAQQTEVTINVDNPTGQDGTCAVQVLNKSFFIVGYKELAILGSLGRASRIDALINTTDIGVSATAERCWFK